MSDDSGWLVAAIKERKVDVWGGLWFFGRVMKQRPRD
jgi:hypothetical protein